MLFLAWSLNSARNLLNLPIYRQRPHNIRDYWVMRCRVIDWRIRKNTFWEFADARSSDSHQHHISETPVFVGCGVRAVGTNESNTYRRTQRKNTVLRSANQYSRTQPITCRKWRFLNSRGAVGRLENGFSAIHTYTNVGILDDNICGMTHFSEWLSIHTDTTTTNEHNRRFVGNVKAIRKA